MFKGSTTFNYSSGMASASNGWAYNIRGAFDSQLNLQPQYRTLVDGYRYVANMAIGLADDDYRARYGVMPGTNQSEFGQWIDMNRNAVYVDAQTWFSYVQPPVVTQPPIVTQPPVVYPPTTPPTNGGGNSPFPGTPGSGTPPTQSTTEDGFFASVGTLGIIAAIAFVLLMVGKR